MITIRSDSDLIIETVITGDGNEPAVVVLNLYADANGKDQWDCYLTILDSQLGRRIRKARVVRLELDLEVEE